MMMKHTILLAAAMGAVGAPTEKPGDDATAAEPALHARGREPIFGSVPAKPPGRTSYSSASVVTFTQAEGRKWKCKNKEDKIEKGLPLTLEACQAELSAIENGGWPLTLEECKAECAQTAECTTFLHWPREDQNGKGCSLYKSCEKEKCTEEWCENNKSRLFTRDGFAAAELNAAGIFTTKAALQAALTGDTSDIENWDVSLVDDFSYLFRDASSFDADLSKWNVAQGTSFDGMFRDAESFNAELSEWDVAKGTRFDWMFYGATSFDADLSKWNVAQGTNFAAMFMGASSFDADLSEWNVAQGTYFFGMFLNAGCTTTNCGCTSCA
jgi:hypothetical protein